MRWVGGPALQRSWIPVVALVGVLLVQQAWLASDREAIALWDGNLAARLDRYDRSRSRVLSADGEELAVSRLVGRARQVGYARDYPTGDLFGHVLGYQTIASGGRGVERTYYGSLTGPTARDLRLSLDTRVQRAARDALGDREGAVVVLRPRTGEVLALWSTPALDPAGFGAADVTEQQRAAARLAADPRRPGESRATDMTFAPGSTMKLVTAAAGLEAGVISPTSTFPAESRYLGIPNASGGPCGGTLTESLARSCNTVFAGVGVRTGWDRVARTARALGFGRTQDLPTGTARSEFPRVDSDQALANQAIGQGSTQATPLQMAVVAATIAADGRRPELRLVPGGPDGARQAISPSTARTLRRAMVDAVRGGTAAEAAVAGVEVGAKTGTAQVDDDASGPAHAWIVGFAGRPGKEPDVAFSVFVRGTESTGEQSGGATAGPIASAVVAAAMEATR